MIECIVELESGVWINNVESGDPGRTVIKENAQIFNSQLKAVLALKKERRYRPFKNAKIWIRSKAPKMSGKNEWQELTQPPKD